jgi:hypothetical protein
VCKTRVLNWPTHAKKPGSFLSLIARQDSNVVTQSRTGLQIYEGHDDQLNRPGPIGLNMTSESREYSLFFRPGSESNPRPSRP